jgi:hypothetical protein
VRGDLDPHRVTVDVDGHLVTALRPATHRRR